MSTVTVMTAERMQEIEDQAVVGGAVVGDNLILERHNGATFDAGVVKGADGTSIAHVAKRVVVAASDANQETIDAADFVCDGTDDQEQIMEAYYSLEGTAFSPRGEMIFSEGNFYIDLTTDPALSFENVTIRGQGWDSTSIHVVHDELSALVFYGCNVFDLTVIEEDLAHSAAGVSTDHNLVYANENCYFQRVGVQAGQYCVAVSCVNTNNTFRDCRLSSATEGLTVLIDRGGVFEDCTISAGADAIAVKVMVDNIGGGSTDRPSYDARLIGCSFVGHASGDPDFFIKFWGYSSGTASESEANCLIDSCDFACDYADVAIGCIGQVSDYVNLKIVNCYFNNGAKDCNIIDLASSHTAIIESNTFFGALTAINLLDSDGVSVIGNSFRSAKFSVVAVNCERLSIENNKNTGKLQPTDFSTAFSGQKAIQVSNSDEIYIVNNRFTLISQECIALTTCNRAYVAGNDMWRCGRQTDNTYSGIKLTTSDDASILNNRATSSGDTVKLKYALEILAGCDRSYVHGNHFYDAADTAAILDSGTSTDTTSDNKVS